LHGPTASGANLQNELAAIEVQEMNLPTNQAAMGHHLRSELVYQLNGSGAQVEKRYRLRLSLRQGLSTPIVDSVSGRAQSAIMTGPLNYTLTTAASSEVITTGTATAQATYDRFQQRFATLRAARDAEIRLARALAQQVRTRLSAHLSQM